MSLVTKLSIMAAAIMSLAACFAASTASATNLYAYTFPIPSTHKIPIGSTIFFGLESGTSSLFKDTSGGANDTCTSSSIDFDLTKDTTSPTPVAARGDLTILIFGGCSHTTTVLANGELEVRHIAGTTNGTLVSIGARVTIKSTVFGISCVAATGTGTTIGTLTGASSPSTHAQADINGVLTLENGCGDSTWTGSYKVETPTGLVTEAS
jgi:hypothetical protein